MALDFVSHSVVSFKDSRKYVRKYVFLNKISSSTKNKKSAE